MSDVRSTLPVPIRAQPAPPVAPPDLAASLRGPRRAGLALILVFLAAFGLWGARAPLAGGAVATGIVSPAGSVRTVQHLEGGIVAEIFVRDGDRVAAGGPLVALESVRAQAEVDALRDRQRARVAERARLEAEMLDRDAIAFPPELDPADPGTRALTAAETQVFETRRAFIEARRRVLAQRMTQLEEQILGYAAQVDSATAQLRLLGEEIVDKSGLFEKGLLPKGQLLALRRAEAELRGFRGEHEAAISSARQRIGETELELLALDAERAREIASRASELRGELAEIDERLAASADILGRTLVTAPTAGTVTNLRMKTKGGVIGAGDPILDIVPGEEALVIEARVAPVDVDLVREGMLAVVHLTAFSGRSMPRVEGTVTSLSADRRVDDRTGQPYFLARVEVPEAELAGIVGDVGLLPGMPAEVLIVAAERTLVEYLVEPIMDAVRRSLREVS